MAKRKSQIELAVEKLEAEKNVLELAIQRLKEQSKAAPARKKPSRPVEVARESLNTRPA